MGVLDFDLQGKLGIRTPEDAVSARFRWQQSDARYRVELWGPFGQGRRLLDGNRSRIEIRDGGGTLMDAGDVQAVMQRQLGWYLPLDALPSWIQGQPFEAIAAEAVIQDADGRTVGFSQAGWELQFDRFAEGDRPRRIIAHKDDYRVTIVLA